MLLLALAVCDAAETAPPLEVDCEAGHASATVCLPHRLLRVDLLSAATSADRPGNRIGPLPRTSCVTWELAICRSQRPCTRPKLVRCTWIIHRPPRGSRVLLTVRRRIVLRSPLNAQERIRYQVNESDCPICLVQTAFGRKCEACTEQRAWQDLHVR